MYTRDMKDDQGDAERIAGRARDLKWAKKHHICFNGLYATDDLASINGVHIMFFVTDETTPEQIEKAKADAKRQRDVVGFSALLVDKSFLEEVA